MKFLSYTTKIAICDRCGFKFPHEELYRDGDIPGLLVCKKTCWDPRDFRRDMRTSVDNITIVNPRPDVPLTTEE